VSPRLAIRLAFIRRAKGPAAVSSCPALLRARESTAQPAQLVSHSRRVLCDRDLNKKPLVPRKYETQFSMVISGLLLIVLFVSLAFLGGL